MMPPDKQDEAVRLAILHEKKMLACLDRTWTPDGISVYSLVDDMIAEVNRLRAEIALLKTSKPT